MQDNKFTGTSKQRRTVGVGCLIVIVLLVLAIAAVLMIRPQRDQETALAKPSIETDTTLLPVLNVDIKFDRPSTSPRLIELVAEATRETAQRLRSSPAEGRSLTAVNFLVHAGEPAHGDTAQLHFTIAARDLLAAAAAEKGAGFYLTLTKEAGPNSPEATTAIKSYCRGASIAFCNQADR